VPILFPAWEGQAVASKQALDRPIHARLELALEYIANMSHFTPISFSRVWSASSSDEKWSFMHSGQDS